MSEASEAPAIRVGIVGAGNWATYAHIPVLQLLPEYEVVAVSSRRREDAAAIAERHGIPRAFGDYEELARHPEVDLVLVLPPAPHHAAVARAAIAAGKDVYCEWPLTTSTADSAALLDLAEGAGVRHLVGIQRRLAPSARYLRDLLADGYAGKVRSVRLHVSEPTFQQRRSAALGFTVDAANFSSIASIYGGHFLDMLFAIVGEPRDFSALLVSQFGEVTLVETGKTIPTTAPDQLLLGGTLRDGAVLSAHIEGGKRSNYGVQLDITGTEGDLRLSNAASFHNLEDNVIEGARGDRQPLERLPVPDRYRWLPASDLPASALELANIYAAHARDRREGTRTAPDFADGLRMHRLLDAIAESSATGRRVAWEG